MTSIPPNNTSGLYGIDGNAIPVGGNIDANNISASGNVTVGGYIVANGSITTNANFVGDLVGNVTGNITLQGSNTQVIYNANGVTGGSNAFTFNSATNVVSVGGNITATGNISGSYILGNGSQLTGLPEGYGNANVVTLLANFGSNTVNTTGNITGGYLFGNGSQLTGLPENYGNAEVADFLASGTNTEDIITSGTIEGSRLQTSGAAGNITGANYISANYFVGDGSLLTNVAVSYGNADVSAYLASGTNTANIITTGNVSGAYILGNGSQLTGLPATYSNAEVATFLANFGSNTIVTTGNITGGNFIGSGATLTNIPAANIVGTVANATYATNAAHATVADSANAVAGANVTGTVANATYATSAGSASTATHAATANTVTDAAQANITSVGTLTSLTVGGDSNITGNLIVGQDLTVNGNTISTNITELNVEDPIISQGRGPNNTPLVSNDGKDRGEQFWYYSGSEKSAFSGYDNSAGKMLLATDVSIANEIVTVNSLGNIVGGNIEATSLVATGTVSAGNLTVNNTATFGGSNQIILAGNDGNISTGNIQVGGSAQIVLAGTDGNISAGNISLTGNIVPTGIKTDGYYYANGTPVTFGGTYGDSNVTTLLSSLGSNVISSTANITTTGNVSGGNLIATGANAQLRMAGTTSNKVNFGLTGAGSPQVDTYSTGAKVVLYDNISNTSTGYAIGIDPNTMWFGVDQAGSNFEFFVGNVKKAAVETDGSIKANNVTYTGTDGTAGQVLTTYGNGVTYFSTVSGGSPGGTSYQFQYNNAGSFGGVPNTNYYTGNGTIEMALTKFEVSGSNSIVTVPGNVTTSNLILSGQIYDTSGVLQLNGSGNIVLVPTGAVQINGPTDIIGGKLTTGAVTYANTDGTAGQVLTTYGNGVTYFSTVSSGGTPGGSDTQIQYNDGGSFGGNAAMTFNDSTGNISFGNLVIGNTGTSGTYYNVLTNKNPYLGNTSTVPFDSRILVGSGYDGNWGTTYDLNQNARGARMVIADNYVRTDTGVRATELSVYGYANLNGATTYGSANANSRIAGTTTDMFVYGGNIVSSSNYLVRGGAFGAQIGLSNGNGNASIAAASALTGFISTYTGSTVGNATAIIAGIGQGGVVNTQIGLGLNISGNANSTGNVFGIYMGNQTSVYGTSLNNGSTARTAANYYFLRNDDDVAQNKLGSIRSYTDFIYTTSSSSGALTIDKSNAQVQYVDITEDITSITLSNFVVAPSNGSTTKPQLDTVTVIFRQDGTGRTITMPSGSAYLYAGGTNTIGSTADSVTMVSISAIYNSTLAATQYLITVSPEFS